MEETVNCEVKKEHLPKTEPEPVISHCDDLANEFVDYTMVSVPITEIAEMEAHNTNSFIDTIEQSTSHKAQENTQLDGAPEAMDVEESNDLQDISTTPDISSVTAVETISNTCEVSAVADADIPMSSQPKNEAREETNSKDDDVVMVLSDSEDEDKDETKTDKPTGDAEIDEKIANNETSEVADVTLSNDDDLAKLDSTKDAETAETQILDSVIMLDDSPDGSEAEIPNNTESSKSNSTDTKGKFF